MAAQLDIPVRGEVGPGPANGTRSPMGRANEMPERNEAKEDYVLKLHPI